MVPNLLERDQEMATPSALLTLIYSFIPFQSASSLTGQTVKD